MIINLDNTTKNHHDHRHKKSLMSRQVLIHASPSSSSSSSSLSSSLSLNKRKTLLPHSHSSASSSSSSDSSCCSGRFGEVAGGTAAECAVICCCCPCGLVNLLFLTIYKVPAGLCRRALRKKRRQKLIKKGLLQPRSKRVKCGYDDTELQIYPAAVIGSDQLLQMLKSHEEEEEEKEKGNDAMVKLEEEMWETFYGTGFWRSPSQREPPPPRSNNLNNKPER